jgi:hypothetical protein
MTFKRERRIKRYLRQQEAWKYLGLLKDAFGLGPGIIAGRLAEVSLPLLRKTVLPRGFTPINFRVGDSPFEDFDASFFQQRPGTMLEGWFQSERYFGADAGKVRAMFRPGPEHAEAMRAAIKTWPAAPADMAAVHIRRGDYTAIRDPLSGRERGWQLPAGYYADALQRIPADVPLALFSDEPDFAAKLFPSRSIWVSRGRPAVVDMLLMTQCRWVVAANSSFSWWGAWLNEVPGRTVFAPLHHLGWHAGRWVPGGIDVDGWNYLPVSAGLRS